MKIEIEIPGQDELREKVVDGAVHALLYGFHGTGDYERGEVKTAIIDASVKKLDEAIAGQVQGIVSDAMKSLTRKTNRVGEPVGEAVTLKSYVMEMVEAYFAQTVDREGRLPNGNDYYNKSRPRMQWLVEKAIENVVGDSLQKHINEAITKIKAQLGEVVTKSVSESVARLLKVPA
jgi:hypothetical protein